MSEENEKKALKILEETRQAWAVIVNRYIKKLQKENNEIKETLKCTQNSWYGTTHKLNRLQKELENRIPISVIEDKIEELKNIKLCGGAVNKAICEEKIQLLKNILIWRN